MLNPVVIPPSLALALIVALAAAVLIYRGWLESSTPWTPPPVAPPAPQGRHRLDALTEPYRPRSADALAADRLAVAKLTAQMSATERRWAQSDTRELAAVA